MSTSLGKAARLGVNESARRRILSRLTIVSSSLIVVSVGAAVVAVETSEEVIVEGVETSEGLIVEDVGVDAEATSVVAVVKDVADVVAATPSTSPIPAPSPAWAARSLSPDLILPSVLSSRVS